MALASWVDVPVGSDFPLENLPYGVFSHASTSEPHIGCALGAKVIDLHALTTAGHLTESSLLEPTLNSFMSIGKACWSSVRAALQKMFSGDKNDELEKFLLDQSECTMHLPARIGDYTDFYSSIHHATNVGTMFRGKDNALQPNWLHLPVGYHGRASSVGVSGTNIKRPYGQLCKDPKEGPPVYGVCKLFDFELETAFFVGKGNDLGEPMDINNMDDNIFGMVLMNDWSARDIQKWEYVPLGPFLGKNMGTVISPWIVTMEALEPYKCPNMELRKPILPYLQQSQSENYDIKLTVHLQPDQEKECLITTSNWKYMYWTMKQQLAHHTVNGCNASAGDLYGSGTISGPTDAELGSMLELSWKGTREITLPDGLGTRKFLKDNDTIIMRGRCEKEGLPGIGFGECRSKLLPANPSKW